MAANMGELLYKKSALKKMLQVLKILLSSLDPRISR
jgi:hypothetical protein